MRVLLPLALAHSEAARRDWRKLCFLRKQLEDRCRQKLRIRMGLWVKTLPIAVVLERSRKLASSSQHPGKTPATQVGEHEGPPQSSADVQLEPEPEAPTERASSDIPKVPRTTLPPLGDLLPKASSPASSSAQGPQAFHGMKRPHEDIGTAPLFAGAEARNDTATLEVSAEFVVAIPSYGRADGFYEKTYKRVLEPLGLVDKTFVFIQTDDDAAAYRAKFAGTAIRFIRAPKGFAEANHFIEHQFDAGQRVVVIHDDLKVIKKPVTIDGKP